MPESDRLNGCSDWIDLEFVERERTPPRSLKWIFSSTLLDYHFRIPNNLERLGVERSRTAIHNWVQKTDVQPTSEAEPDHIAVDETVIQLNDERHWLFAAVDSESNEFLHVRLFQTRNSERTMLFLRELREKIPVKKVTFLVDDAHHLKNALRRLELRFQMVRHGNRNAVERVFREVKRRTSSFSNTFSNAQLPTIESWLETFAVWWNQC